MCRQSATCCCHKIQVKLAVLFPSTTETLEECFNATLICGPPLLHCLWVCLQIDCAEPDHANHYRSTIRRWMRHLLHGTSVRGTGSATASKPGRASQPAAHMAAADTQTAALPAAGGHLQGAASSVFDWDAAEAAEAAAEGGESSSPRWQGAAGPAAGNDPGCSGGGSLSSRRCCFVDTFRHFYPARTDVATCWSTLTSARSAGRAQSAVLCRCWARKMAGGGCARHGLSTASSSDILNHAMLTSSSAPPSCPAG